MAALEQRGHRRVCNNHDFVVRAAGGPGAMGDVLLSRFGYMESLVTAEDRFYTGL